MRCVRCGSETTRRDGHTRLGGQRWRCARCRRRFTARSTSAFSGPGFPDDVIALAVRWYARFRLSYAAVAEWLAERGFLADLRRRADGGCSASGRSSGRRRAGTGGQ
jgi:hypothetical protein